MRILRYIYIYIYILNSKRSRTALIVDVVVVPFV